MKKTILYFLVLVAFIACKQSSKEKDIETKVVVEIEAGREPTKPEATEIWDSKPKTVIPGENNAAPSDAIVLFDGTNFKEWVSSIDSTAVKWVLNGDGSMTVKDKTGDIQTKRNFDCVQLHVEWQSSAEIRANGQNRSNSGIFLQNRYEVQILDNNDNGTYSNGQVGSIYKQSIPLAKASVVSGAWNTYDIIYHAPKFDSEGNKTTSATITVLHNGVLIQDHFKIKGTTEYIGWPKNNSHGKAPLRLQDHNDNSGVSYRNIWVRELH